MSHQPESPRNTQMLPNEQTMYSALPNMYELGEDIEAATLAYMVLNGGEAHPNLQSLAELVYGDEMVKQTLLGNPGRQL